MENKLPTLSELYQELPVKSEQNKLNVLLNNMPKAQWVKNHPMAKNVKYIPIERIEYLLTAIFVRWHVEVKTIQLIGNSVLVCVRLHYQDPLSNSMLWQDGIGASPLQTNQGAGATDFNALKNDAVMKAAPAAESYAVKDAAEKIGKIFGKDLNRADHIGYESLVNKFNDDNKPSYGQISKVESLINTSTYDDEIKEKLRSELHCITQTGLIKMQENLMMNQLDQISSGGNYNQTDIKNKLKFEI